MCETEQDGLKKNTDIYLNLSRYNYIFLWFKYFSLVCSVHLNEKPYKCSFCEESFFIDSQLKQHLNSEENSQDLQ